MPILPLLLALVPCPRQDAPDASGALRSEYFLLVGPVEPLAEVDPSASLEDSATAAVVWRRRVLPEGDVLEREIVFRDDGVSVMHVEHTGGERPRLVWREVRPDGGRTWLAQWSADRSQVETTSWGPEDRVHARLAPDLPGAMPLELAEEARHGTPGRARRACLSPLAGGLAPLSVEEADPWRPDPTVVPAWLLQRLGSAPAARAVTWRRDDGSLVARLVFEGEALLAFQLQDGELWAIPVDEARHREFVQRWSRERPGPPSAAEILAPIGR